MSDMLHCMACDTHYDRTKGLCPLCESRRGQATRTPPRNIEKAERAFDRGMAVAFIGESAGDALEAAMDGFNNAAFVHVCPDTKIHTAMKTIEFWDDGCIYEVSAETLLHLYNLQLEIEALIRPTAELPFDEVLVAAKSLKEAFDRALSAVKFKPILSTDRRSP